MKRAGSWWLPDHDAHFERYFRELYRDDFDGDPVYQPMQQSMAYAACQGRGLALDVGAHVGLWTRHMKELFDRVIAFEPIPENAECLRLNVPEAEVREEACYSLRGKIWLANPQMHIPELNNSGAWRGANKNGTAVRCVTLDELDLAPDFIKIDVQGLEEKVLMGAMKTIARHKPTLCVETDDTVTGKLAALGYRYFHRVGKELIASA